MLYLTYEKPWSWIDFDKALLEANASLDEVTHPVDMIIQMHDGLPSDVSPARFRVIFRKFHTNVRDTALIGANPMIRHTISAFMRVMGQGHRPFFFAASVDDALKQLAARHPQHPPETQLDKVTRQ